MSEPITHKETTSMKNSKVMVASSSMQGWRISMEDAHQHILELSPEDADAAFFGVYDGHGGAKVAKFAAINLHRYILNRPEYKANDIQDAVRQGFLDCDRAMKMAEELKDEMAGCTAVTALIKGNKLWCGNAGDSRCIGGVGGRAVALSRDHKPNDPAERERIVAAGGFVEYNRVNGNLALSRALGDFFFKKNSDLPENEQIVSAEPEVQMTEVTEDWDFLLLACDGIWDVLSNQQVADFITTRIGRNVQPEQICEELMDRCLAPDCQVGGLGCDNMTVVLVCFLHNQSYGALVARCAEIVRLRDQQIKDEEGVEAGNPEDTRSVLDLDPEADNEEE